MKIFIFASIMAFLAAFVGCATKNNNKPSNGKSVVCKKVCR